jgi:hypothetical protein
MSNRKYRPKIKQGQPAQPVQHDSFTQSLLDDLELVRKFLRKAVETSFDRFNAMSEKDPAAVKYAQIGVRACSLLSRVVTIVAGGAKLVAEQAKAMKADAKRMLDQATQKYDPAKSFVTL